MSDAKNEIIRNLKNWAEKNKDVICVIIAGSTGNTKKISDEFSDIDVVVFTHHKKQYDSDDAWISQFGEVACCYGEKTDVQGVWLIRKIYFANGAKMDLLLWQISKIKLAYRYIFLRENTFLVKLLPGIGRKIIEAKFWYFSKYIRRGFDPLVDKCNLSERLRYIERNHPYRQPGISLEKLQDVIYRFWSHALATAIYIHRNELFCAKIVADRAMKQHVLHVAEIYTWLSKGREHDTFDNARFFEQWGPEFIVERMNPTYGRYDADDAWRANMETVNLFSDILERFSIDFPEIKFINPEQHFRKLIQEVASKRKNVLPVTI